MSKQNIPSEEKAWHWIFEGALLVRGFNGILETAFGIFIIYTNKDFLTRLFNRLTLSEFREDPTDRILNFIANYLQHLSANTKIFVAIYILAHGLLNIFLSIQLYREKIWAYRLTLIILIGFLVYQVYRTSVHHSIFLSVLTILDCVFIILLWHEYKFKLSNLEKADSPPLT